MKQPSMVSNRLMPAAKRMGRDRIGVERQPARHRGPGQHEQRDLGRRVEPEAEEHADRVHLPRRVDPPGEPPKNRFMRPRLFS